MNFQIFLQRFLLIASIFLSTWVLLAPPAVAKAPTNNAQVVIYTASWCPYCKKARAYLNSIGVPYIDYEIDRSENARKKYAAIHANGVPIIFIGQQRIEGFDPDLIQQALVEHGLIR